MQNTNMHKHVNPLSIQLSDITTAGAITVYGVKIFPVLATLDVS